MLNRYRGISRLLGLVSVALFVAPAFGQGIEEIVVTAQKRDQSIQDVGMSISALSGERINRMGLDRLDDYADFIPGLFWSGDGRAGPNLVIRGISNNRQGSGDVNVANLTTAMLFNDIPVMNVDTRLPDLQRIEVLRGPQGTLYGAAAMGGLIKFIPAKAETSKFSARVAADGGIVTDGGTDFGLDAMVNMPIIDNVLGVRAVAWTRIEDGFIDMRIPGDTETGPRSFTAPFDVRDGLAPDGSAFFNDVNKEKVDGLRLAATYTPNDAVTIRPMYMYQKRETDHDHIVDYQDSRERYTERFVLTPANQDFELFSVDVSVDVGAGTLEYVGGRYERDRAEALDSTNFLLSRTGPTNDGGVPDHVPLTTVNNNEQTTHELRYQQQALELGSTSVDFVVGAFYQQEDRFANQTIISTTWNIDNPPQNQIQNPDGIFFASRTLTDYEQTAFFADVTVNLTDKLSVAAGIRHFDQEKDSFRTDFGDLNGSVVTEANIQEDGVIPRAQVTYKATDANTFYMNYGEGFRIGGQEVDISQDPVCSAAAAQLGLGIGGSFDSDAIESYELGSKNMFLDRRLTVNTSVYYIDWTDLQQQVQLSQVDPACGALLTFNVGEAVSKGFELEFDYSGEYLSVYGSLSMTDAEVTDSPPGGGFEEGDNFANVPEWSYALGGEYRYEVSALPGWSGYLRADWRWVDDRISTVGKPEDLNPFVKADSYSLTNLRAGFESESWSAALYLDNVFDETIVFSSSVAFGQGFIQAARVNRPRTIGLSITRNFGGLAN